MDVFYDLTVGGEKLETEKPQFWSELWFELVPISKKDKQFVHNALVASMLEGVYVKLRPSLKNGALRLTILYGMHAHSGGDSC